MLLLVIETVHVTVLPPPFPEPLHWSTVTGSAADWVEGVTVHRTRMVPPPPLPELLHWMMVALVVLPLGLHKTVGWMPPPPPEPLHWLMVAGVVAATPVMLLTMETVHVTVLPPPLPDPLHWLTAVMSWFDVVVDVVQGSAAPAAPWHSLTISVELVSPVARSRLLVTVTVQATAWPPTLSVPLHWVTASAAATAASPLPLLRTPEASSRAAFSGLGAGAGPPT